MFSVVNVVVYKFMYGAQFSLITQRPDDGSLAILHAAPIGK